MKRYISVLLVVTMLLTMTFTTSVFAAEQRDQDIFNEVVASQLWKKFAQLPSAQKLEFATLLIALDEKNFMVNDITAALEEGNGTLKARLAANGIDKKTFEAAAKVLSDVRKKHDFQKVILPMLNDSLKFEDVQAVVYDLRTGMYDALYDANKNLNTKMADPGKKVEMTLNLVELLMNPTYMMVEKSSTGYKVNANTSALVDAINSNIINKYFKKNVASLGKDEEAAIAAIYKKFETRLNDGKTFTANELQTVANGLKAFGLYKEVTESGGSSGGGGGGGGGTPVVSETTVTITAGKGETIKVNGATIVIPSGAFAKDMKVKVKLVKNTATLPMPSIMKLVSQVFDITKDVEGNFDKSVTITLSFDKAKVDTDKYDLGIFWLNEETKKWVELDNVKVDLEKGTVSGEVEHFTKFAVLAIEKEGAAEKEKETTPEKEAALTDIKGHWAEANILKLVESGAISGYPNKTFKPNNNITRAEFATMLVKAFDLEQKSGKVFADTASHWAKDAIATAEAHGIVSGYNANKFGPNDLITREQMAAMVVKAADLKGAGTGKAFADSKNISAWAVSAVNTATEKEIIKGYPDNSFKPQGKATRAEAVTVVVNALK